jgi:Ca2+/Na+ antiporter
MKAICFALLILGIVAMYPMTTMAQAKDATSFVWPYATLLSTSTSASKNKTLLPLCANLTSCGDCANSRALTVDSQVCHWCSKKSICRSALEVAAIDAADDEAKSSKSKCTSWCSGHSGCEYVCEAPCSTEWAPCSEEWTGQVLLMALYGAVLAYGASLIGEGSELLLEVLDPGLIGALLLPILGAVPDAMLVVASGITGTRDEAQTQLSVGMGTLAGSTVMLGTLVWSASMWLGRCDIRHGEALDRRLTLSPRTRRAWFETGVTVDDDTKWNARIAVIGLVPYCIVQAVAFAYLDDPTGDTAESIEKWVALAGFIVCMIGLVGYCTYQILNPKLQEKKMAEARRHYNQRLAVERWMHLMAVSKKRSETSKLFDAGGDRDVDVDDDDERAGLLDENDLESVPARAPVDIRGLGLKWRSTAQLNAAEKKEAGIQASDGGEPVAIVNDDGDDEDRSEIEGMSKGQILRKATIMLTVGILLVTVLSDPMVGTITRFGDTVGIGSFYLSFVLTPLCSNASELISSLMFAAKKRRRNASLTYSQIYGAFIMNSTLVLGVFYALITFRDLAWTFSAETLTIIIVTLLVAVPASIKTTFTLIWAPVILALYPLSLLFVWILETYAHWT